MLLLRPRLGLLTWFALVARLALGLRPAVSHALARAGSGDRVELGTSGGLARMAAHDTPAESNVTRRAAGRRDIRR